MDSIKPRLYIVREEAQASDGSFADKYQAITNHLVEVIRKDGRLDLEEFSSNAHDFAGTVAELREQGDFEDRPNAFLFVRPGPENEESSSSVMNDLGEIADASMLNAKTGARDPVLASSHIFFNRLQQATETEANYQDLIPTFEQVDFGSGEAISVMQDNLDKLTKLFIDKPELEANVESYGKELVDHVIDMHKSSNEDTFKALQAQDNFDKLSEEQQGILFNTDWLTAADNADDSNRQIIQIITDFFDGMTLANIAAKYELTGISQINQILQDLFRDPDAFIAKHNIDDSDQDS